MLHFCFGVGLVSEEWMKVFLHLWSPRQTAPMWSMEVSNTCTCAGSYEKGLWHCCLLLNLGTLCPQMSQIQLCIAQHVEFSSLSWKLKLKFAVSAYIFSLCFLNSTHALSIYLVFKKQRRKSRWMNIRKNLWISVLGICPCSLLLEEIQLHWSYRHSQSSWVLFLGREYSQKLAFHMQLCPWNLW